MAKRLLKRPPTEREIAAQRIYERLSPAMAYLGVLFLLTVLTQALVPRGSVAERVFLIATWVLWAVFVLEFSLRLVIAPSTPAFLKRNWWQALFLAIPFLSFFRVLLLIRVGRATRVVLAAARGTRSAKRTLGDRLAWLSAITVIVILAATDLLYEFAGYRPFLSALHTAAMTAISGESGANESVIAQVLDIFLALYSVVFFASLAGMLGAFFLERRSELAEGKRPT